MSRIAALAAAAFVLFRGPAAADDYAATARNIIPSGQYGSVPPPAGADQQALMYDALTPLFDQVTDADLLTKFKSEGFGVGADGPGRAGGDPARGRDGRARPLQRPAHHRRLARRRHVGDGLGARRRTAGCCSPRRATPARLAAIDAPNIDAFGLVTGLKHTRRPSRSTG